MNSEILAKRLKRMAKDSANTTMTVLALFSGVRATKRNREEFSKELRETIEQIQRLNEKWKKLEAHLMALEAQTSELNEQEIISVVEQLADTVMMVGENNT